MDHRDQNSLTVTAAARQLGISRTRAYELVRAGVLEATREGRAQRVTLAAIDRYRRGLNAGGVGERLLSPQAVADRLEVARVTVYRWMRRGELATVRLSRGCVRVPERALAAWISRRR